MILGMSGSLRQDQLMAQRVEILTDDDVGGRSNASSSAQANGYKLSGRGRVTGSVQAAYREAHAAGT